jgi:Domain of unknown function (DUF4381)
MKAAVCVPRAARVCLGSVLLEIAMAGGAIAKVEEDIRDIRGPKAVPTAPWVVLAVLVGALLVTLCAAYAIWRHRHRGASRRILTLSEQTLERLEGTRPLMHSTTAREFGIAASEVIRSYIERRFEVVATQQTTEEFLQTLLQGSHEPLTRHRTLLAEFLQQCDFVKFAGASLAVTNMEALLESARGFVLQTGEPGTA